MTAKIIQIAIENSINSDPYNPEDISTSSWMYALCSDGTMWKRPLASGDELDQWQRCKFPDIPEAK